MLNIKPRTPEIPDIILQKSSTPPRLTPLWFLAGTGPELVIQVILVLNMPNSGYPTRQKQLFDSDAPEETLCFPKRLEQKKKDENCKKNQYIPDRLYYGAFFLHLKDSHSLKEQFTPKNAY